MTNPLKQRVDDEWVRAIALAALNGAAIAGTPEYLTVSISEFEKQLSALLTALQENSRE